MLVIIFEHVFRRSSSLLLIKRLLLFSSAETGFIPEAGAHLNNSAFPPKPASVGEHGPRPAALLRLKKATILPTLVGLCCCSSAQLSLHLGMFTPLPALPLPSVPEGPEPPSLRTGGRSRWSREQRKDQTSPVHPVIYSAGRLGSSLAPDPLQINQNKHRQAGGRRGADDGPLYFPWCHFPHCQPLIMSLRAARTARWGSTIIKTSSL